MHSDDKTSVQFMAHFWAIPTIWANMEAIANCSHTLENISQEQDLNVEWNNRS